MQHDRVLIKLNFDLLTQTPGSTIHLLELFTYILSMVMCNNSTIFDLIRTRSARTAFSELQCITISDLYKIPLFFWGLVLYVPVNKKFSYVGKSILNRG